MLQHCIALQNSMLHTTLHGCRQHVALPCCNIVLLCKTPCYTLLSMAADNMLHYHVATLYCFAKLHATHYSPWLQTTCCITMLQHCIALQNSMLHSTLHGCRQHVALPCCNIVLLCKTPCYTALSMAADNMLHYHVATLYCFA